MNVPLARMEIVLMVEKCTKDLATQIMGILKMIKNSRYLGGCRRSNLNEK